MQSLRMNMRGEQKLLLGRPPSTHHQQVDEGEGGEEWTKEKWKGPWERGKQEEESTIGS